MENTTIAAIATPPGKGGIAIIRLSGPMAQELLEKVFVPSSHKNAFESHFLMYGKAVDQGQMIDECMAVIMKAPRSYTREDVAEIHLHGGEYVTSVLLHALWGLGAKPAQPGEFTKRAFLNGRVDLSRAEAVMQIIEASGKMAAKAAIRDLKGGASAFINKAQEELTDILAGVAASLDYPEEIAEEEAVAGLLPRVKRLSGQLLAACDERSARMLEKGMEVAIVGRPNVGKSSLLNCLLEEQRAIVTDEAGTTRDIVRGSTVLDGLRINFSDTAGIRQSNQKVEQIGIELAKQSMQTADLVLAVFDRGISMTQEDSEILRLAKEHPYLLVLNKSDLPNKPEWPNGLSISTKTGEGIEELKTAIRNIAGQPGEGELSLLRHMHLARQAASSLSEAADSMEIAEPFDLVAIHLHEALYALGEVTGEQVTDALLDKIFLNFCVGK
ncbi:MAG: tRNA uridine-5-carboxymethylaminomethyl(34) synthesis GTPase MnmE [Clostridiales bacterium]|nr:tRNA uridine-5-carboxymethylaminomethyl(34) synthesis GTPase MnmE [Clostridiales bacterium]